VLQRSVAQKMATLWCEDVTKVHGLDLLSFTSVSARGGGFLSKQTLLASEALAGKSSSLDLMNIDEEAGESLEKISNPSDFSHHVFARPGRIERVARLVDEPGSPRRLPVRRSGTATALTSPRWIIRQRLAHIRLGNPKVPRNP
jgi:hypothetical protein